MAIFCIMPEQIDKLKNVFNQLSDKNQLQALSDLSPKERVKFFEKVVTSEEATLLNRDFERAIASEKSSKLIKWIKSNFDPEYRAKQITQKQKQSIRSYIEENLYPTKRKSEIISSKELSKMSDKEINKVIEENFDKKEQAQIKEQYKKAVEAEQKRLATAKEKKPLTEEQKKSIQRRVVENYIGEKKAVRERTSVPIDDIIKMQEKPQLEFLKKLMPEDNAILAQKQIQEKSQSTIEKEINKKLETMTNLRDFNKYLDKKAEQIAAIKEGAQLHPDETHQIMQNVKNVQDAKAKMEANPKDKQARLDYGMARQDANNYLEELKSRIPATSLENFNNVNAILMQAKLSFDLGITTLQSGQVLYRKGTYESLGQGVKNVFSKQEERIMKADILSNEWYDLSQSLGSGKSLRLPIFEHNVSKMEEIGAFNKLNTVTKNKYTKAVGGTLNEAYSTLERFSVSTSMNRMNYFAELMEKRKNQLVKQGLKGEKLDKQLLKEANDTAKVVNKLTSSSNLGALESQSDALRVVFLAARLAKSHLEAITVNPYLIAEHYTTKAANILRESAGKPIKATRYSDILIHEHMKSTASIVAISGSLMMLFSSLGYEVQTNPFSSQFGKVKIGDTYRDLTLGFGSYISLVARELSGLTVTQEGVYKKIDDQNVIDWYASLQGKEANLPQATDMYGKPISRGSVAVDFMRKRFSIIPGIISDLAFKQTVMGKTPTVKEETIGQITPLIAGDFWDAAHDTKTNGFEKALVSIMSFIGQSGYTAQEQEWDVESLKTKEQFKKEVGAEDFKKANKEYNDAVSAKVAELKKDPEFKAMNNMDKASTLTSAKKRILANIYSEYGFHYKAEEPNPSIKILSQ